MATNQVRVAGNPAIAGQQCRDTLKGAWHMYERRFRLNARFSGLPSSLPISRTKPRGQRAAVCSKHQPGKGFDVHRSDVNRTAGPRPRRLRRARGSTSVVIPDNSPDAPPPPDYEAESKALAALARELAESPGTILQKLAETALAVRRRIGGRQRPGTR